MNSKIILTIVVASLVIGTLYLVSNKNNPSEPAATNGFGVGSKVTVYKDPNCGCCVGYAEELKKQGFEIDVVPTKNMSAVKEKYNIPTDKQSCHTITMGDYFIEGHVPMEAVEKLLKEQPDIAGIGLPRMPSGTPGMPGPKRAPYEVYKQKNSEFSEFIII